MSSLKFFHFNPRTPAQIPVDKFGLPSMKPSKSRFAHIPQYALKCVILRLPNPAKVDFQRSFSKEIMVLQVKTLLEIMFQKLLTQCILGR